MDPLPTLISDVINGRSLTEDVLPQLRMRRRAQNGFLVYVSKQNGVKMTAAEITLEKKVCFLEETYFL